MFSLKIIDIKREMHIASQKAFLDVEVSVLNEKGKFVETRKFAYDLETTEKTIKSDLERFLKDYQGDFDRREENKEADEIVAKADKTAKALKGAEIEGKVKKS